MPAKPILGYCRAALAAAAVWMALVAAAPAAAQDADGPVPPLPPLEVLSETVERPLFRPDRRPPSEDEVVEVEDEAESGIFSLVGIIVSPTERIALVKVRGSQQVLQLSEGQQANGWTVVQIRPQEVVFESNDKTETVELIDIRPTPRRRPTRQRQPAREAQQPAQNESQNNQ